MKKRLLSNLLCICMVISLMSANTIIASAEVGFTAGMTAMTSPGGTGDIWIFANGTPITIEAKGTGTVIKADNNGVFTEVDLADVTKSLMNGETSAALVDSGENGYDLSHTVIFGGNNEQILYSSTSITMNGGMVGSLVGGSYARLTQGNTNITINGGTLKGADLKTESVKSSIYAYFVGGGLGDYGYVSYNSSTPGVVSGEANVTINGGSFDTQFSYYTYGYAGGCGNSANYNSVCSANLFIHGGSFNNLTKFYSSIDSKFTGTEAYTSNTGKKTGFYVYCNASGLDGKINTEDRNLGNNHSSYILTCDEGALATYGVDKSRMMVIDSANKTYRFGSGATEACLFSDYTIPAGYKLQIPEEVTLTVNSGVNVTNNGTIYIKGTLTNNGTISGSGYLFKRVGGVYQVGAGAIPTLDAVQFQIEPISTLTIEKGQTRGTAKITSISAEVGCTYYYRVYDSAQIPPKAGDPFNEADFTVVSTNTEFIAYLNDVTDVYEVKDGKVQKYSSVPMTEENLCGPTSYDALDTAIIAQGEKDNTTKITASADTGNTLYYKLSDSVQGSDYVYNTIIDSSSLSKVVSGADITAEAGKYISVYELNTNGYLKKFVSVQLTNSNFRYYTGGLVADTDNKRIYCNGAKVAYTSASYQDYCQLYVYADGQWKAVVPRNLDFISGAGFSDYTLYGGTATDSTEAGTLYILTVRAHSTWYLPKNAEGFANYIIPDFSRSDSKWFERYLVKGNIDLNSCPYGQCWMWTGWSPCYIQSITLEDNAHLTLNTGDGPTFVMEGQYTDIIKGANATITNIQKLAFTPYVDIKLFDKEGKEFSKNAVSGKYQIPKDAQVTIAGAVSLKSTAASFGEVQQPVSSTPKYIELPHGDEFNDYSIGFYSNKDHKYYTGSDVDRKIEGTGENAVRRVKVTLPNFNDYSVWNIELRNYNGDIVEGYKYNSINTSISFDLGKSAILPPAPTNGVVDDTANTFNFTAATGYDEASLYEYSTDGGISWNGCTSFSINVGNIPVSVGNLQVRLKSTDEFNSGNILSSTVAFTAELEGTVSITGNTRVGETLTADTQGIQSGAVRHYQWKAEGVNIGADKNTYKAGGNELGKTITVTVTADGYMGDLTSLATDAVGKGNAQTLNLGTLNISNGQEQVYTFNLKSLLPNGVDFGNVTYSVALGDATDYYLAVTDSNISSDTLSIAVKNVTSSEEKSVGTITVKIISQYYDDMQADININSTNKMVATPAITGVFHYVYGEKLSDRSLTGSAIYNGNPVNGNFVWISPAYKPNVSDLSAKWRFIPDEPEKYLDIEGIAEITVSKATLSGNPAFTAIKEAGKKLSQVALTAPDGWPLGNFSWADGANTIVGANTAYGWVFTPDDTDNYNVRTGTVIPYTVSNGGGSSSGGHGGSSTVKQTEPATQVENPVQNQTPKSLEAVKKDGIEKIKSLKDIKENAWFYEGTVYALGNGWFEGTTETTFSPGNPMTREMFRVVLGRMGADANELMDNNRLKENVTKEQLVTLLYRMAQKNGLVKTGEPNMDLVNTGNQNTHNLSDFADGTQVSAWAKEAMAWANAQGILEGNDRNMITPKAGNTRAEVAVILMRFDTIARNHK